MLLLLMLNKIMIKDNGKMQLSMIRIKYRDKIPALFVNNNSVRSKRKI